MGIESSESARPLETDSNQEEASFGLSAHLDDIYDDTLYSDQVDVPSDDDPWVHAVRTSESLIEEAEYVDAEYGPGYQDVITILEFAKARNLRDKNGVLKVKVGSENISLAQYFAANLYREEHAGRITAKARKKIESDYPIYAPQSTKPVENTHVAPMPKRPTPFTPGAATLLNGPRRQLDAKELAAGERLED